MIGLFGGIIGNALEFYLRPRRTSVVERMREIHMRNCKCPKPITPEAEKRAVDTLRRFLSAEQLIEFEANRAFTVTGNKTGTRYRITSKRTTNIIELWPTGKGRRCLCFVPKGEMLPLCDQMLMQKLCLETDEWATLAIAVDQGPVDDTPMPSIWIDEFSPVDWAAFERDRRAGVFGTGATFLQAAIALTKSHRCSR